MLRRSRGKRKRGKRRRVEDLPVVNPRSAGIDLGARVHYACAPSIEGEELEVESFRTTTPGLRKLIEWLKARGIKSVAMESTGVFWVPVFEMLEQAGFSVILANARQLQKVPGRKTDVLDCQWIQRLHACGLLRGSFRPNDDVCRLRALVRQMANYVTARGQSVLWMQKALDQMNVAVHRAVSDVTGMTGMKIIRAIVEGERDPMVLAELRDPRCKLSKAEIAECLTGNWREDHLFNLEEALRSYDGLCASIQRYEERLREELERLQREECDPTAPANPNVKKEKAIQRKGDGPTRDGLYRFAGVDLTTIDGINVSNALIVLSEVGPDLSAFPTERDFVGWMRLCPQKTVTGGKIIKKKKQGTGATRIGQAMRSAAVSVRSSKSALGAEYRRIARRKGAGVAVFATARKIATIVYRMLRYGQAYVDVGAEAYENQYLERRMKAFLRQAEEFGCEVIPRLKSG